MLFLCNEGIVKSKYGYNMIKIIFKRLQLLSVSHLLHRTVRQHRLQ